MPGAPSSASTQRPESSGQGRQAGGPGGGQRLQFRIGGERVAGLVGFGQAERAGRNGVDAVRGQQPRHFAELAGIVRGDDQTAGKARHLRRARRFLRGDEVGDAGLRQRHHGGEIGLAEDGAFSGRLHFDQGAGARHDEIGVGLGGRILSIVEIEQRRAGRHAAGHGGHMVAQRHVLHHGAAVHPLQAIVQGDPGAGDGGGSGAPVGLEHVAIDRDLPLAHRRQVRRRPAGSGR